MTRATADGSLAARRATAGRGSETAASTSANTDAFEVRIIRSARRKKTISARLVSWHTLEVRVPAHLSETQLQDALEGILDKARDARQKMRAFPSDKRLQQRASKLNAALFDGALRWRSIRFVTNQNTRFGSCSPSHGTIRISHRLANVPDFVLDYVIVHELAHLTEPNHSKAFWDLVYRYDKTERARGYLMALQLGDDAIEPSNPE